MIETRSLAELFLDKEEFERIFFDFTKHPKYPEVHDLKSYWADQIKSDAKLVEFLQRPIEERVIASDDETGRNSELA